jgi:hypothetical protein
MTGCRQPVDIPPTDVKTVEAYGVKLDELATPQQVVYVLLRSIREDVEAAQAGDRERQKQAFRTTFALGAYSEIERRLARGLGEGKGDDLGELRDKRIHDVINHWAPIAAHYVRSFDLDEKTAVAAMHEAAASNGSGASVVLYEVAHDPAATDPAARQPAILEVTLVRERATGGSQEYWRVVRVAFRGPQGKTASRPAAQDVPSVVPLAPVMGSQPAK